VQTSGTAPDNDPRVADVTTAKKNRIAIENFAPDLIPKPGRFNEISWPVVWRVAKAANHKKILIPIPAPKG
jgi:hypothetical protein